MGNGVPLKMAKNESCQVSTLYDSFHCPKEAMEAFGYKINLVVKYQKWLQDHSCQFPSQKTPCNILNSHLRVPLYK